MPSPATLPRSSCSGSSSRLLISLRCSRSSSGLGTVVSKRTPMALQQRRLGHSWISGHPHSLLYKPATAANQSKNAGACGGGNGVNTGASSYGQHSSPNNGSNSGSSSSSSFLDFAGNSRYQAYALARFSTLSVASSASSSSSSSSSSSTLLSSSGQAGSSGSQAPGSSSIRQEPTDSASARHHEDRAHSNPADTQSPASSSTSTATTPLSTSSLPAPSSASKKEHDDTEDAWAVNESYSGHASSSSTTSSDNDTKDDRSRTPSFSPDSTSSKPRDPAAIEASWRRTSDSIPSTPFSGNAGLSSSSSSKAGGLDLSSSTLVQQMLFKERAPHADSSESNSGESKQDQQYSSKEEPSVTQSSADSTTASPSLTSMLLNQSSGDASDARKTKATQQQQSNAAAPALEEEDHISKLDIRVGIVRSVTTHPDAESLYIEQVDVGDKENGVAKEPRTIVSGLVRHVPKEYLEGRAVIVVGNMKPSKLRGVMSQGMLLCAMEQDSKGEVTKVGLLEPAEGSEAGDKVTLEGFTDLETVPAAVLTPKKKWFEKSRVHFSVQDGVAYYKGSPFRTVKGLVRCKSISKGEIS
ncbi:hypothetical protein EC991_001119 [Linnemannia zychae]|nr:hypothetical protein EC991_001119 [Linnemannia zychae]